MSKKKESDLTKKLNKAHYEILKCIQEGMSITQIAKYRRVSRQAIYEVLTRTIKKGWVNKITRGVYKLTESGTQTLHSFVGLRYHLRQHNLHFKIEVLGSPRNWHLRRQELRFLPYFNRTIQLKNNEQDLFNYGQLQVKTTSKSVIIKMPTIYAKSWEEAVIQSMQLLEDSIPKIEKVFSVKLIKAYKSNITVISNEYAEIQSAIAKLYRTEGNRVYLTGDDGRIWLITDFSFSTDELEYIHPNRATDDIDAIAPFFNDLRRNPTTITRVREDMKKAEELVLSHAVNINKHQKVLDAILKEFEEFKKWREKQSSN